MVCGAWGGAVEVGEWCVCIFVMHGFVFCVWDLLENERLLLKGLS